MALGMKGWVGFRKESTPGTPETGVTWFLPFESFLVQNKHDLLERKVNLGVYGKAAGLKGKFLPQGKLDGELIAGLPHPFYWTLGSVTSVALSGSAYSHTMGICADGSLPSLTCEADEVLRKHRQAGVNIDTLELSCTAGETALLKLGWLAKAHNDTVTPTSTPTYKTDVLTFVGATVTVGATALTDVKAVDLKIDNGLEQVHVLTSDNRYPAIVQRKDVPKITGKLSFIDYPADEYNRLQNADTFKLTLEFEGDAIGATVYKRKLEVVLYACQYTGGFDTEIKGDVITKDGDFEAFYSTSDSKMIEVTCYNDVAQLIP